MLDQAAGSCLTADKRPRLLVISQVYVPDPAAVGQYVADAAEGMARRGWEVVVYAASRGYDDPTAAYATRENCHGVSVRRLPFSSFGKNSIAVRLLAQSLFLAQAFLRSLFGPKPDLILVSTSPPFAGFIGATLSCFRQVPFVWWVMDINPDQLIASGKVTRGSLVVRIFDWMNRVTLRRARTVVALDRFMADRLREKYPAGEAPVVIPPWPLIESGATGTSDTFRRSHGLEGKFVVMYSGNHALQHPLDTLLDAAHTLEGDPRVVFVFVGGGAGKQIVDHRIAAGATNLCSLPPAPFEHLADVLTAADLHVVTMGDDMVGIVHPSKVYTAMAVARPILFFGPACSHVAELVTAHGLGWVVSHGNTAAAVAAICEAADSRPARLDDIGRKAAAVAAQLLSAKRLRDEFCDRITLSQGARACATSP